MLKDQRENNNGSEKTLQNQIQNVWASYEFYVTCKANLPRPFPDNILNSRELTHRELAFVVLLHIDFLEISLHRFLHSL